MARLVCDSKPIPYDCVNESDIVPFTWSPICISNHINIHQCLFSSTNTHNNNRLRPFVRDYTGEPVPEETLTHPPSWSSSNLYQLLRFTTIHTILPVQITCLAIFFAQPLSTSSLVYLLVWSPPPHIPYISSPKQCLLFATHAHTIATCFAAVSLLYHLFLIFLSTPHLELYYLNITHPSDHSHLCSLKCQLIFFPDRSGLTSVQHTTSHTTTIQPPSPNQW